MTTQNNNMNPVIDITSTDTIFKFTLSGVDTSIANALRRTILSDIPTVVFNATSDATIYVNTSKTNNEILKHQLSCIPIYIKQDNPENPINDYLLEINVENTTDTILDITTNDFKIKNIPSNSYISEEKLKEYFPPNNLSNDVILFTSLRPKLSDSLPGEKIHLECKLSVDTAKHNGKYSVASICSYGCTTDKKKMEEELKKKETEWKDERKNVLFETKNWKLLDGLRIIKPNSFDFRLKTIGVFENTELIILACKILIASLTDLRAMFEERDNLIQPSLNTMKNSFDIRLENHDYTIGNVLEFILYELYFEQENLFTFCGFKKFHPHDNYSIIRIALNDNNNTNDKKTIIQGYLFMAIDKAIEIFQTIAKKFEPKSGKISSSSSSSY